MENWKTVSLNRSGRPILEDDEHNLYVREDIGLYQGKLKVVNRQNGRVYITNKRLIYVDNEVLDNSLAIYIRDIDKLEASDRFLRSSPKVKVIFKEKSEVEEQVIKNVDGPWICMICTFSNNHAAQVCASCGIKKMAMPSRVDSPVTIDTRSRSEAGSGSGSGSGPGSGDESPLTAQLTGQLNSQIGTPAVNSCPFCTFINHPSLKVCEMCGSELNNHSSMMATTSSTVSLPINLKLEDSKELKTPYVKFSFRKGGEKVFFHVLQEQLDVLKWDTLVSKGNINMNGTKISAEGNSKNDPINNTNNDRSGVGIHGLEQIGEQQRKLNELVLSSSLEDLEQLMYKAQDLIKLSSSFSKLVKPIAVTQNLIPQLNIKKSSKLYHRELSRHISEYLHTITLTKMSSMITVQDLFAHYNRYLSSTQGFGTELISDIDLDKAIELFEELNLPFKRKRYEKSGLVVITPNLTNNYTELIKEYVERESNRVENDVKIEVEFLVDEITYFKGKSVAEIAENFNWSYSIAEEEIESCVNNGTLVVDENITGTFYFVNEIRR